MPALGQLEGDKQGKVEISVQLAQPISGTEDMHQQGVGHLFCIIYRHETESC